MLWACLYFPALGLNLVEQGLPRPQPVAIEAIHRQSRLVLLANDLARKAGVTPGMSIPSARGLVDNLHCSPQNEQAEIAALRQIGHWAYRFTPHLYMHDHNSLLLEVSHSLKLFHGPQALAESMRATLPAGFTPFCLTFCETANSALLFAHLQPADQQAHFFHLDDIAPCSIDGLAIDQTQKVILRSMGITTVAQLLALPRDALAKRLGPALVEYLKKLTGDLPDVLPNWKIPEQFAAELEFIQELDTTDQLVFPLRNLLGKLEHYLRARQSATTTLDFALSLRNHSTQHWPLTLAAPHYKSADILPLLQLKLAHLQLQAPVRAVRLQVTQCQPLPAGQQDLLTAWRSDQVSRHQLVDRLKARLGDSNVNGLGMVADHRPESGWAAIAPGTGKTMLHPGEQRPFWLLQQPQKLRNKKGMPMQGQTLQLIKGPERIETGWWDNQPINRDYFIARNCTGQRVWIYRNRDDQQWYLHGIFGA